MELEASVGASHVATSATTTSCHELDLFSITVTSNVSLRGSEGGREGNRGRQ